MSDTESLDYLQSGFEPASLTVPRLRSILVSHDIEYPSAAKKPQLIQIFTDNVLPQSRKILAARARARRTSKGITDADSQQTNISDEGLMPPPPTPRTRSRKPSSKVKSEESESDTPKLRSPAKRTPRASNKYMLAFDPPPSNDLGDSVKKSTRKSRKSELPTTLDQNPEAKVEDVLDSRPNASRRESAFTYDNPFQSGSSPLEGASMEKVRRSSSKDVSKRKITPSKSQVSVQRTKEEQRHPSSTTFEIPVSEINGFNDVDDNGIEISEEFTPEEQLDLMRNRPRDADNSIGPLRPRKRQTRGFSKKGPLLVASLTLLVGYAGWYRREKIAVGYCGVGREATQIVPSGIEVPVWARTLVEPDCEPCPQHAYCFGNFEARCEADFLLQPHPLSFGGVVPLPPTCEPDGEKVRKVKAVADRAIEELRERRAKWECGDLKDEAGTPLPSVEIDAEELKKEVSKKRRKGMSEAEFEELWSGAIGEIEGRDEVEKADHGNRKLLLSTSLARLSLVCTIRRSFRLGLARYRLKIASLGFGVALLLYLYRARTMSVAAKAAIPNLVSLTLDRLAIQAASHAHDKEIVPEGWISIGQLRDDVLRNEHSIRKRETLWSMVKPVVEMNANVRASQREGRNGEISRVWEWIGPTGGPENGERRKKGGRVSWGAYDGMSSPVSGTDDGPEATQMKWEEGRPIY